MKCFLSKSVNVDKTFDTILTTSTGDALIVPLHKNIILQRQENSAGFVSLLTGLKLKQLKTQNHASRNKLLDLALELSVNSSQKLHIREDKDNLKKLRDEYMDCPVSAYAFAY